MHILYLDDSGSSLNPKEQYFVLGGLSVPENSVRWLTEELDKIACSFNPTDSAIVELHAAEIYNGKNFPWTIIKFRMDRVAIIKKVLNIMGGANKDITLFASAIHKASWQNDDAVILAFEDITSRFNRYLQRISVETGEKQRGILVLDNSSYESGLQNLASQIHKSGNRWGGYLKETIEVPLFVDSRACRIVQLADHIAYAVFRRYNAEDIAYMNIIENRFDDINGKICGLSHQIATYRTCTCPACLSRR